MRSKLLALTFALLALSLAVIAFSCKGDEEAPTEEIGSSTKATDSPNLSASPSASPPPQSGTLGLRCSVASQYLKKHFDLPDQRGCVVLRVSGAAAAAGIRQGDLMIKMDEIEITSGLQFTYVFEQDGEFRQTFTFVRSGAPNPLVIAVRLSARGPPPDQDEDDPFFYYLRAKGYVGMLPEEGIRDYSRAIELAPDFDLAYMERGHLYMDQGDRDSAEQDYNKAIELSPEVSQTYRLLAFVKSESEPKTAINLIIEAMRLDECSKNFYRYNVECALDLIAQSDLQAVHLSVDNALASSTASIEYYPNYPAAYYQLALLYDFLHQPEKAKMNAEQFLSFEDISSELYDLEKIRRIADSR